MPDMKKKIEDYDAILNLFVRILVIITILSVSIKPFLGEKFDYLYVFVVYILIFLIMISPKVSILFQKHFSKSNIFRLNLIFLVNIVIVLDFYYLGFWSSALSLILTAVLSKNNLKVKEKIAKYIFPVVLISFILNLIKTPNRLIDNFHPLFITDELFSWINNKHIWLDFMGQYNSILGIIFIGKSNIKDVFFELNQAYWYLIILQLVGLLIIYLILREITKKKIELILGLIFLFSITGGLVWANLFSILDFFQELPSRKIFPLITIYLFMIYLKLEIQKKNGWKYIALTSIGTILGISILNDYLFSTGVFISILTTVFMFKISIKSGLKNLFIIIISTTVTLVTFILINYPRNSLPKIRVIFSYVFSYGENQFGHEFNIIGPDIFFFSLAIFGLIWSLKNNINSINLYDEKLDPVIFLFSLLLCYNGLYWMGRSYEIQIVASSGIYSALLITALYVKSRQFKNLESLSNLFLNIILISPFLFNLINFKSITNDYFRLINTIKSEFMDAQSVFTSGPKVTIDEISAIDGQIDFVLNKVIMTKEAVALVSEFGNLFSAKYAIYNANILNHPTSITNPFVMEIICKNALDNKMKYLLFAKNTEKYINNVELCFSNYKQIIDVDNGFPRFNLYKFN
jgi:hypothetical protein